MSKKIKALFIVFCLFATSIALADETTTIKPDENNSSAERQELDKGLNIFIAKINV